MNRNQDDAAPKGAKEEELPACRTQLHQYSPAKAPSAASAAQTAALSAGVTKVLHSEVHGCICAAQPHNISLSVFVCRSDPSCKTPGQLPGSILALDKTAVCNSLLLVHYSDKEPLPKRIMCRTALNAPLWLIEFLGPRGPSEKPKKQQNDHADSGVKTDRYAKAASVSSHLVAPVVRKHKVSAKAAHCRTGHSSTNERRSCGRNATAGRVCISNASASSENLCRIALVTA